MCFNSCSLLTWTWTENGSLSDQVFPLVSPCSEQQIHVQVPDVSADILCVDMSLLSVQQMEITNQDRFIVNSDSSNHILQSVSIKDHFIIKVSLNNLF